MFESNQQVNGTFLFALLMMLVTSITYADDPIVPPPGGQDLLSFQRDSKLRFHKSNVEATAAWTQVKDVPLEAIYQVESDVRFCAPENMQVIVPIDAAIKKGDVMLLSFWICRPGAGGQPNNVYFSVQSETEQSQYEYKLSAYREWKQHVRSFVATADCDPASSNAIFELGEAGTIAQIAELRLINYGADYDIKTLPRSTVNYKGREFDAQWREDALARIEKIRKADITVQVVDARDNPIQDAKVTIQMQRHAFGFGNAVNAYLLGGNESMFPYAKVRNGTSVTSTWSDAQKYREIVKKYFNCVTFESELRPHVWKKQMSGTPDGNSLHKVFTQQAIPWLQANNVDIRGHYLAWAAMDFNAMEKQFIGNPDAHRQWLWEHMADVLRKTSLFVSEWDTINHIIAWGKHTYEIEYGGMQIYADIMKEARRLAPNATHAINEGKVLPDGYKREPYKRVIRFLNEQGQAPDTVGFMGHFELMTLTPPEELLEVYDRFAEIAPRLQLSEFDVEAGDDEQLQADYFRDVMIATFSHPNFVSIVQWGFWEKAHWKPAAALWRADWSLKPSGKVFVDLVAKQWWTDETARTNAAGNCQVRGFLGDYHVTVEREGQIVMKKATLNREGAMIRFKLK
ncbi:Endo-1,4-beta-xylanase Z precursor [Planctomycetes bacterium CA13]|uniref:endo-1,4-beta-xylanase n=1 Tax=Novipirellula herctigrandis TaxID=2527986 RepID=A0A5C5Z3J5_9BACT|nr:Endo-1,4-beta-xylanase Z precursor [Planctomycetes bacterium CA13]